MDVKVNTKMINDLNIQRELLKTALEATDAYLGVERQALTNKKTNPGMLHEFSYHMLRAKEALTTLGVLDRHTAYMTSHVDTMNDLTEDSNNTDTGEVSENKKLRESVVTSFSNFIAEKKEQFTEEDINEMVNNLTWEDIVDLYPEEDLIEEEAELLDEKISATSRLKRRQGFARGKSRRNVARGMKLRRASTPQILQKRAQLAARRAIYQRLLRGRDKSALSASEKDRIEMQVKGMKGIQASIATRMVPKMRSIEQKRLAHYRGGK